jgi:hypothetical protein
VPALKTIPLGWYWRALGKGGQRHSSSIGTISGDQQLHSGRRTA